MQNHDSRIGRDAGHAAVMGEDVGMAASHAGFGPLVLGIETSCDETGVALVRGDELLVDAVASSMDEHARYGGIIPEVASRAHLEAMIPTITRALGEADVDLSE